MPFVVSDLSSHETILQRIDASFEQLYWTNAENKRVPYVCAVCDEHLIEPGKRTTLPVVLLFESRHLLHWKNAPVRNDCDDAVKSYYRYDEMYGGEIVLASESSGGAEFTISLPFEPTGERHD